jgi:methyltransferase
MFAPLLLLIAFVPMIGEAVHSAGNERRLRAGGAVEPPGDVFAAMQVIYPACFAGMILETWVRAPAAGALTAAGAVLFAAAKGLKYWAIATLGPRWTFRVLVPPASTRTIAGPYRFLRHPNYLAVGGELTGFALLAQAPLSGILSVAVFGLVIAARVRVEERALAAAGPGEPPRRS